MFFVINSKFLHMTEFFSTVRGVQRQIWLWFMGNVLFKTYSQNQPCGREEIKEYPWKSKIFSSMTIFRETINFTREFQFFSVLSSRWWIRRWRGTSWRGSLNIHDEDTLAAGKRGNGWHLGSLWDESRHQDRRNPYFSRFSIFCLFSFQKWFAGPTDEGIWWVLHKTAFQLNLWMRWIAKVHLRNAYKFMSTKKLQISKKYCSSNSWWWSPSFKIVF